MPGLPTFEAGGKLSTRIPTDIGEAAGFDAGIACALHLIPDDKQRLSAVLHGAYTPEAVAQVRAEAGEMDPDSETCWWLAANSLCREARVDEAGFQNQIESFMALAPDAAARRAAALKELKRMRGKFSVLNGVAFVYQNGGLEGAYVAGHSWAVTWYHCRGSIWLQTYYPTLGLDGFPFSSLEDDINQTRSGLLHGSSQIAEVSDFGELARAIEVVRAHLG